jgi:hypothetical protein
VVAVVVLTLGVGALARAGTSDEKVSTQPGPTLPAHQQGDLVIFMKAAASSAEVDGVRDRLLADSDVTRVLYSNQADTMEDFRCLFADERELVANVTADILPSSFRIDVAGGQAEIDAVHQRYADVDGVLAVQSPADVVAGTVLSTPDSAVDEPSPVFTSDCPLVGAVLK